MPFVERRNRDHIRARLDRRREATLEVGAVLAVARVGGIPRSHWHIVVARANARHEQNAGLSSARSQRRPVARRGTVGESVACKVRIVAVKTATDQLIRLSPISDQSEKDSIKCGSTDRVLTATRT